MREDVKKPRAENMNGLIHNRARAGGCGPYVKKPLRFIGKQHESSQFSRSHYAFTIILNRRHQRKWGGEGNCKRPDRSVMENKRRIPAPILNFEDVCASD